MCVIVFKNIGVEAPSQEIFEQCWESNPDGFGMAVAYGDHVELQKGFMTMDDAWLAARNVPKECAALLHFRIGTSGKNDGPTCHPFPISREPKELRTLRFDSIPYAVVHNGIIGKGEGNLSDTQVWVRDKLSMLYKPELVESPYHRDLVQLFLDEAAESYSSRFAVLNADGSCLVSGDWCAHESGLQFSNNNWKYVRRSYYSGNSTGGVYDWWYGSEKPLDAQDKASALKVSTQYGEFTPAEDEDEYYDDLNYGYTPVCPYCGSYDTVAHEGSQYDLCECYECSSIFNGRTGDEYGIVMTYKDHLDSAKIIAKEAV